VERPQPALKPKQGWTADCLVARTEAGQGLKLLIVRDEDTRERLAIRGERRLGAGEGMETREPLCEPRGATEDIRSDNGPACISPQLQAWLGVRATRTVDIKPGPPGENGEAESVIGKWREEGRNEAVFRRREEARVGLEPWRREDNQRRPQSALGYPTPAERALRAGCSSVPAFSGVPPRGLEASQGHRRNISVDQF
jgi:transposase InsO family protein